MVEPRNDDAHAEQDAGTDAANPRTGMEGSLESRSAGDKAPAFNAAETKRFLAWLGGPVALTSFDVPADERQRPHETRLFRPEQFAEAVAWAERENAAGRNVYFTVNEVRPDFTGLKPAKTDIIAVRCAWADADPACSPAEPGHYAAARAHVEKVAVPRAAEVGASAVVWSGNGVQIFFKYDQPRSLDGQTKDGQPVPRARVVRIFENATARAAHAFDGTAKVDSVQNVDRLMRLPGTVNYADKVKLDKGYPRATQSRIISLTERTWTLNEIIQKFPAPPAATKEKATGSRAAEDATPLDEGEKVAVEERLARLRETDLFVRARWEGRAVGLGDSSRSGIDMSLGGMLKQREFTYREMRHALTLCPAGAGAEKAAQGDERYFERIWTRSGFSAVPVEEVKATLMRLALDAVDRDETLATEAWAKVLYDAHLDPNGCEAVLTFLSEKVGVGKKRAINQTWKDYFAERSESYRAARSKDELALRAKERAQIHWNPLDYSGMLPQIEAELIENDLMRLDRAYVYVAEDELPYSDHPENANRPEHDKLPVPKQVIFVPHTRVSMMLAIEKSVCLYRRGEKGAVIPIEVPDKLPPFMLDLPDKRAPRVTGLSLHPIITPDGRLISAEGLDRQTGLYVALGGWQFGELPTRPTRDDAVAAARRVRELLLAETMLKDKKIDGAAVIGALLTGVARKATSQGPAVLINATVQGTGKTTLARMMHVVLTGREMAVQTLPDDQGEARKQILSTLLRSPAMVNFDNIPDGSTIDSPVISSVITSPTFSQRILGLSQDVEVPTCSLLVFTGNSISIASDLIRRFVKIDLLATEACPEQRRYRNADPVRYTQSVRAQIIRALLTIQQAWFAAGAKEDGPSLGLGVDVDRLVTWPLAFAGEEGIFEKRAEVALASPEEKAKVAALVALAAVFKATAAGGAVPAEKEFTSTDAIRRMNGGSDFAPTNRDEAALRDAIEATDRKRVHSAPALGHFLGTLVDQPPREGLVLRGRALHGRTLYHVERGGVGGV